MVSALVGVVVLLLTAGSARAHLGQDQFGRFPFVASGAVVGGGTSWGLVLPDEVYGGYGRVCEESFGPALTFVVEQPGRILAGGVNGVEVTTDGGCTWNLLDNALAGRFPNALWVDPVDASHMLVGTSTIGADNGVWRSDDSGDTWTEVIAPRQGNFFSLAVNTDGTRIAVGGNDGVGGVVLLMSVDGGVAFTDVSAAVSPEAAPRVIVTPLAFDGSELILGGLAPSTQGFVDRVSFDGTTISVSPVGVTPRQTTHAVVFDGDIFVIARNGARGELLRENGSALGFGVVVDGPSECVFVNDDRLIGCGKQAGLNPALFVTSADGITWETAVAFSDVHYRACPEDTVGLVACSSFLETFCGDDNDDDFDGATDCVDDDCAFNSLCFTAEGEGEGEEAGEGEGEGESGASSGSCCRGDPAVASVGLLGVVLRRRRRR